MSDLRLLLGTIWPTPMLRPSIVEFTRVLALAAACLWCGGGEGEVAICEVRRRRSMFACTFKLAIVSTTEPCYRVFFVCSDVL